MLSQMDRHWTEAVKCYRLALRADEVRLVATVVIVCVCVCGILIMPCVRVRITCVNRKT
jgi:hypothetical protein